MVTVLRNRSSSSNMSLTWVHCSGVSSGGVIAKPDSSSVASSMGQSSWSRAGSATPAGAVLIEILPVGRLLLRRTGYHPRLAGRCDVPEGREDAGEKLSHGNPAPRSGIGRRIASVGQQMDVLKIAGFAAGASLPLVVGGAVGVLWRPPRWLLATALGFAAGALISAVAFGLVEGGYPSGRR